MLEKAKAQALPQSFVINLYAYILSYWDFSQLLSLYPKPDQDYAWQIALSANLDDLQKRDIATVASTILNIAGRPSTNLTGNATNVARVVALSHGMGLNHDPSDWKISEHEKMVRWKLWWTVLILDRWVCVPPILTSLLRLTVPSSISATVHPHISQQATTMFPSQIRHSSLNGEEPRFVTSVQWNVTSASAN